MSGENKFIDLDSHRSDGSMRFYRAWDACYRIVNHAGGWTPVMNAHLDRRVDADLVERLERLAESVAAIELRF